jgi:hypothetical protein
MLALAFLALPPAAPALASPDLLPDLVAPAPTNPQPVVTALGDGQDHFLLRFDGAINNIGAGRLEIRGSNPVNGVMTVTGQRIYRQDSTFYDDSSRHPQIQFETADGHDHWHVKNAARFSLWNEAGTAEVAPGAKVGFCLEDVDPIDSFAGSSAYSSAATEYCKAGQPNASRVFEGISSGWQDFYAAKLPFQWVDISDVAPGRYRLATQVDPDNFVLESNETDNGPTLASEIVTVPGWLASSGPVTVTKAQTILLGARQYGSTGPASFKIESAPKHGKLSAPAGATLPGYQVVYTPNSGFAGSDVFTFSARDSSSPFPIHSPVGTVTVTVSRNGVQPFTKQRLLTRLRFSRHGRFLTVRAHAKATGLLRILVMKGKRHLGACARHARTRHRFHCRIKLRKHASLVGARVIVRLIWNGRTKAINTFQVPRRLRHS